MRATIHLASARDCTAIRPLVRPVATAGFNGHFGRAMGDTDVAVVVEAARW